MSMQAMHAAVPTLTSQSSIFHGEVRASIIFSPAPLKQSSSRLVVRSVYPSDPFPPRVPRQGQPNEYKLPQEEWYTPPPPPVPYYGVPVKAPPPPGRLLDPEKRPLRFTNAEPPPPVPENKGLSILGIPELDLPAPPDGEKRPKSTYRSPYAKPDPPVRPYEPLRPSNPKVIEWLNPPPPPTELMQREQFKLSDTCSMTIFFGDITKWRVDGISDAIVAPANKKVNAGAAVDGVIHKAAGHRLMNACQRLPEVANGVKCEVGMAVSTKAFNIPVSRIIHAVGPVYEGRESDADLEKTYISALALASKEGIKHIVFPPISCRIYGYPYGEGAKVALKALKENCEGFNQIDIVVRNIEGYEAFIDEASESLQIIKDRRTLTPPQPEQQQQEQEQLQQQQLPPVPQPYF